MVEVILEYSNELAEENIRSLGKIKYHLPIISSYVLEVDEEEMWRLQSVLGVSSLHKAATISVQMNRARQTVNADAAHTRGIFGRGVTIAVLDTGISPVADLAGPHGRILTFKDFINGRDQPYDDNGHGTHVPYLEPVFNKLRAGSYLRFFVSRFWTA